MQPPPPITRALLIACTVLLFAAQIPALAAVLYQWLALHPVLSGQFWPWQVLTYAFVHVNVLNWLFNMMMLYYFGAQLEEIWGERRFIQFLLACALTAAATYLLLSLLTMLFGMLVPLIDASGVGLGMLVAFGILFPQRRIQLFFVLEVTMRNAVWIFLAIDVFLMLGDFSSGTGAWIRDVAQFGGALGGYLMILYWRWRPPSFKRKKPSHIRRVH
jgi:membrane associated rhomboid family serine protease